MSEKQPVSPGDESRRIDDADLDGVVGGDSKPDEKDVAANVGTHQGGG